MKKYFAMFMATVMTLSLCACGGGGDTAATGEDTYTLKMHLSVGSTDPVYASAEKFAELVEEKTNGNVTFELYPSSSLGVTQDCLEGLSMRACDVVYDSMSNLSTWTELANIEAVPYMYNDVDHFRAVWEGEVGDQIRNDVGESAGLKVMGCGLQGVRVMTGNKPVTKVEDVQGLKIRVPTIDVYLKTWDWLGAATTPLAGSEIFTALQQGTVDAQENAYPTCVGLSLQECSKYVTETNHVYSMTTFVMDKAFFESMPAEYQAAIEEASIEAGKLCTDLIVANAEDAKQKFVEAGAEIYEVDLAEWQDAMDGFLEENYPNLVEYYNMILDVAPEA
ncbi:MAG: TRAP transporter substrate-binding protein [Eubacterium sp.]|nr:TRAP transporter substrate-binding protein [Eubacterium sp.]MBQ9091249.1 TRAP transporter substrate-binding protein [Anaerotignum sp.]